jgi:hypothetical protein
MAGLAAGALALGSSAGAAELVQNGDFSAGNSGFGSTYAFGAGSPAQGTYVLTTDPNLLCGCFASYGDHTSGSGNMLYLDGAQSGDYFWSETIAVVPNQTYQLSFWGTEAGVGGPQGDVVATVNGLQVLDSGALPYATGDTSTTWHQYQTSFNSGAASSITLRLYDSDLSYYYNDFTVDDIGVTGPAPSAGAAPEPGTWAMMLVGVFGAGALLRRRRSAPAV